MTSTLSCPNCGARAEPKLYLLGRERWLVVRCVGLDHPSTVLTFDSVPPALPPLSPPCGWFRWEHQVTPSPEPTRLYVPPLFPKLR